MSKQHSAVVSRAKKEIRQKDGIRSGEKIYIVPGNTPAVFALRIFLSELILSRRDITFVQKAEDATLLLTAKTLDETAEELLEAVLDGTVANYLTSDTIRTIHPFSAISEEEICRYARQHGWNEETTPRKGRVHDFLAEFSEERPSALYALKNVADKLHEKADMVSPQIHNQESL